MDNPLEMVLPLVGFAGGILVWSRVAHVVIAISGLEPNPSDPVRDPATLENAYRRLV
jgi:hypothetical protein